MARNVFFSFEYSDVQRAMTVRNSNTIRGVQASGFLDKAEFEKVEAGGDAAIKKWIDQQMIGTSVTVVLVGARTCSSKWVRYEIEQSILRKNGLLIVDISGIKNLNGHTTSFCGSPVQNYPLYRWVADDGYNNLGKWVEAAASAAAAA